MPKGQEVVQALHGWVFMDIVVGHKGGPVTGTGQAVQAKAAIV
jgi:hypothetical protein